MEEQEIAALKNLRTELLTKANTLLEKLKEQEKSGPRSVISVSDGNQSTLREQLFDEYKKKLWQISCEFTGVAFENIDKKWLQDDIYCYTTSLVTKFIKLYVELTISLKTKEDFEIHDVTCHFVNLDNYCLLEIEPWVQRITKMKNFSLFVSAISQYSEKSIFRKTIIDNLKKVKYGSPEECNDGNGGILLNIHSPKNARVPYLKFRWSILFLDRTWDIEHFFTIHPLEIGMKFADKNQDLLNGFCKLSVTKQNLEELWSNLCLAIDSYERSNESKNS